MIFEKATKKVRSERRKICKECPDKRGKFQLFNITFCKRDQCIVCLCDIKAKTSLKLEECPKGKW